VGPKENGNFEQVRGKSRHCPVNSADQTSLPVTHETCARVAQRSIGEERFGFAGRERAASSLDELVSLIDWSAVAELLDPLHPIAKGELNWPLLVCTAVTKPATGTPAMC
jgi:hypothetical protein